MKDDKAKMVEDPQVWRDETLPFLDKEARASAREVLRKKVTTKIKTHKKGNRRERRDGQVRFNKQRYNTYVGWWDDVSSGQASSDFEKMRIAQN